MAEANCESELDATLHFNKVIGASLHDLGTDPEE
jgi:hypothetical protein